MRIFFVVMADEPSGCYKKDCMSDAHCYDVCTLCDKPKGKPHIRGGHCGGIFNLVCWCDT